MDLRVRPAARDDHHAIAELICISLNYWYQTHGRSAIFPGGPAQADVFLQVYDALEPGNCVVVEDQRTGQLAGSASITRAPRMFRSES